MAVVTIDYGEVGSFSYFDETPIYNDGMQSGYSGVFNKSSSGSSQDTGNKLVVDIPNSARHYAWAGIQVDMTNIDAVLFNCPTITHGSLNNAMVSFVSPNMPNSAANPSGVININTDTQGVYCLNTRAVTGNQYVGIGVWSGDAAGARHIECDKIILVKAST